MNRFLLDTHILLWSVLSSGRLSREGRAILEDGRNELYFSAVNCWEITIKRALGRPDFQVDPRVVRQILLDTGLTELVITSENAITVGSLPLIHGDPFDRLLIAQAISENLTLLTSDIEVGRYAGPIHLV